MKNFETLGRDIDGSVSQFSEWFSVQSDAERLAVAVLIGIVIGLVLVRPLVRSIVRVFIRLLRTPDNKKTTEVVATPSVPVVPNDHWHDPKARYGVLKNGSRVKMVKLPDHLGAKEESDWSWELFNVDWATATACLIKSSRGASNDSRTEILPPPAVQSRDVGEGDQLVDAEYVYVVERDNKFEIIPATVELPLNVQHRWARVIGGKMLAGMADQVISAA